MARESNSQDDKSYSYEISFLMKNVLAVPLFLYLGFSAIQTFLDVATNHNFESSSGYSVYGFLANLLVSHFPYAFVLIGLVLVLIAIRASFIVVRVIRTFYRGNRPLIVSRGGVQLERFIFGDIFLSWRDIARVNIGVRKAYFVGGEGNTICHVKYLNYEGLDVERFEKDLLRYSADYQVIIAANNIKGWRR